ncbi:ribonuclease R [Citromicrobium bathyomarinum]|uniref:ribonuclease R n=1 Tax=Citromicrobium bathyomarinum TaxID=72174 RepID=UPI00315AFAF0
MAKRANNHPKGLPTQKQVLDFIQTSDTRVGKREIAKAFGLKGQEKIALKKLLKDMAEDGLIDGKKSAFHRMGGLPKVTVLRVTEIDDGEPIAVPENWEPDDGAAPPRLTVIEKSRGRGSKGMPALKVGDRILSRTEETPKGWRAHPMKKLPQRTEGLIGVVERDGRGKFWLAPVDKKVRNSSPISDVGTAEEGQLVSAEPTGRGPRAGVRVTEVLGDPLAPKSFSLIAIEKHGIPHVFPEAVLNEAELAAKLPVTTDKREDLRDVPIIAIDPADARDHDDAIWAAPDDSEDNKGGFRAIVAIADVSHYVRPGGALDREARKRGNSVYFPDRVIPMLPEILSADVCSLKAGEDRAAMVCHLQISPEGELLKWRFTRAVVRLAENVAYEEAQRRIDAGEADEALGNLWKAWGLLWKAREARDPLDLDLPERRVILDEEGGIAEIRVHERLDAHRVVEDFMIAANVAAAKALESKNSPVVYRVHEQPSREKLLALKEYLGTQDKKLAMGQVITPTLFNRFLKDVSDEQEKALLMEAVLRTQTQAYYGPDNQGHFGLALGSYAHFTSPIRRYADLLVHRALVDTFKLEQAKPKSKLPEHSGLSDVDRDDLGKISEAISRTERRAMEAERDTIDRYVAAWLAGRVGETFDTRITGVQNFGFFATIVGLGGDGLVPISTIGDEYFHFDEAAKALIGSDTGTRYETGQKLEMKLVEANPLTGALRFEVPGGDASKAKEGRPRGGQGRPRHDGPKGGGQKKGGPRKDGPRRDGARKDKAGKHQVGKRGRPGNIRHQGRKKK